MEVEKMRKSQLGFLSVIIILFALVACATSQEKARTKLNKMNVSYDEDSFVQKAVEDDTKAVEYFLAAGMDPNVLDKNGNTALIMSMKQGHEDVVNLLLGYGADLEVKDKKLGQLPLSGHRLEAKPTWLSYFWMRELTSTPGKARMG